MPDIRPINATTHFKCAFDVQPSGKEPLMVSLRKLFRHWVKAKVGKDTPEAMKVYDSWFFNGNNKSNPHFVLNGNQVRTGIVATDDIASPAAWVMELIHRDSDESARRWSVDVGLVRNGDETVRFTTVVSHWMIPNYIGAYLEPPLFNTPRYIRGLLKSFVCLRGTTELSNQFTEVTHNNVQFVYDQLRDAQRRAPFVFVTKAPSSDQLVLDPVLLYRYLLGNANVFAFFDDSVLEGMNYFLGDTHQVEPGTVRCYQTDFDKKRLDNSRIHRFFTSQDVNNNAESVVSAIANGFARNSNCFYPRDITQFSDIFTLRRAETIKRLLAKATDPETETSEELKLFIEENQRLEKERAEYETLAEQCMREKELAETALGNAQYRIREAENLKKQFAGAEQVQQAIASFAKLPSTLPEALTKIGQLFPQKVVISTNAFKTAGEHAQAQAHWRKAESVMIAWEMCFNLVTKGYDLFFNTGGGDKKKLFKEQTGFDMAMTEGKQTKKDSRLMDLRQIEFDGQQFDMTPHLKYDTKPEQLLRIHFAIDDKNQRLIIGHVGAHIENATSRTLS
jgi:hypothetical protein